MRQILNTVLIASMILLSVFLVTAQTTNPWSASSSGQEKDTFTTLDDVYVKSNSICEPATEVDLYVVLNIDDWEGGEFLEDVRGEPDPITLEDSKIPLTKIWSKPDAGEYDIVIDCNLNGEYDQFIDKIDSFSDIGFEVEAVAGTGKVAIGDKDAGDHNWRYDSEEPNLLNEMLQLNLLAEGEDIALENITIKAKGSGNDAEITALEIYVDENKNGKVDINEIMIGDVQPAYASDNDRVTLSLDYFLTKDLEESILIVYIMGESIEEGEFSLTVDSIYGIGEDSSEIIKFSGPVLDSGIKTALQKKTCLGTLALQLDPNPAPLDSEVRITVSDLTGCKGEVVSLRKNPCGASVAEEVGSCTLDDDGGCEVSLDNLDGGTYHACLDKNEDGDMIDVGEYDYEELIVTGEIIEEATEGNETEEVGEAEETVEGNETEEAGEVGEIGEVEEIEGTTGGITGVVIGETLSQTNSFFILLEVTLLLILFVLVMILFKLRAPLQATQSAGTEEKEEKEEDEEKDEKKDKKRKSKEKEESD